MMCKVHPKATYVFYSMLDQEGPDLLTKWGGPSTRREGVLSCLLPARTNKRPTSHVEHANVQRPTSVRPLPIHPARSALPSRLAPSHIYNSSITMCHRRITLRSVSVLLEKLSVEPNALLRLV